MLDYLFTALRFAIRQRNAFTDGLAVLKQIVTFKIPVQKLAAAFMAMVEMFSAAFWDTPRTPRGPELDLTGYELVFEDEFNGDAVDTDVWTIAAGGNAQGWYTADQARTENGNLIMSVAYKEDGPRGAGWYLADLNLKQLFCKGYFEIRCKVFNNTCRQDFWSAFWITVEGEYDPEISKGGPGGCEIDVYESFANTVQDMDHPVGITPAMWCNGVDDDAEIDGVNFGQWYSNDPVNEFNTYGVLWTDEYYIWYINGVEAFRTDYGNGTSEVPEQVRVSLCAPSCKPENLARAKDQPGDYIVDYVRIWQLPG